MVFTTLVIREEIQKLMTDTRCDSEHCNSKIICMLLYKDIVWRKQGNTEKSIANSVAFANYVRKFLLGRWSILSSGSEKK